MKRQEVISRLRNSLKEVSADTKYTNRYLWNVFWTNAVVLLKQESDKNRLQNQSDIWTVSCIKMEKTSPMLCTCINIPLDCVMYRSVHKLPEMVEGTYGRLYRFLSSPDLSNRVVLVSPIQFQLKDTKYNREAYAFIHDDYLWSKTSWPYLIMSYIPVGEVPKEFDCNCDNKDSSNGCNSMLNLDVNLSNWLIQTTITMSLQELGITKQFISDNLPNINDNDKGINER